jgi:hypothetical protein
MRLYLYIALALIALATLGYVKHLHTKAGERDAAVAALTTERAARTAERAAHAHELKIAREVSHAYQSDLSRLQAERDRPLTVRLCKPRPVAVPAASRATERSDAASSGHVGREAAQDPGPDIGDQLLEFGIACEANALQLTRLQEWVRAR